jgi:hypothetical protein
MTINVLGLGESLVEYLKQYRRGTVQDDLSIGVNDIAATVATDFVVCVDLPEAFTFERAQTIRKTECKGFYSSVGSWSNVLNFKSIEFNSGRGVVDHLDNKNFCYSISSPYVAAVLAYKMGAKKIVLHGVDFRTHKNFKDAKLIKALNDFRVLNDALKIRGVQLMVSSSFSALSEFLPLWPHKN